MIDKAFLPKGKEIKEISREAIKRIQDWYNRLLKENIQLKEQYGKVFSGDEGNMQNIDNREVFSRGIRSGAYIEGNIV
ncbi:hypothetical protein [Caldicellulosiruptor morganii]|uniref:Uncharacterized protein n=1 Tax=Caldicellulosiruptor morganii TaxID=1387555 RepID=A0ABY7BSH2_9FIRM|nr:hypothetical protein [Caldicellulosiruptor morganii]WAM34554.1 hypothetical protein OTK00_000768 [Caldicellulosiruptor morganii]